MEQKENDKRVSGKKVRDKKEKPKKSMKQEIFEWVMVFVVAAALAFVVRTFIFEPVRVDGSSMLNTLTDSDFMIATKFDYLLGDDDLAGRAKMYAKIKMEPGALLGFHEHKGETETYYIVSGEGVYFDGVKKEIAKPGDVFHCENNTGHSLENTGKGELEFIALILPA